MVLLLFTSFSFLSLECGSHGLSGHVALLSFVSDGVCLNFAIFDASYSVAMVIYASTFASF